METRELKFRVWEPVLGVVHEPWDLKTMTEFHNKSGERISERTWLDGTIFMQFTGLKDKNGKEIYEGDVLNYKRDKVNGGGWYIAGTFGHHPENAVQVIWDEDGWWVQGNSRFARLNETITFNNNLAGWEVIGNIYANPDLLK